MKYRGNEHTNFPSINTNQTYSATGTTATLSVTSFPNSPQSNISFGSFESNYIARVDFGDRNLVESCPCSFSSNRDYKLS